MSDFSYPSPSVLPQLVHTYSVHSGLCKSRHWVALATPATMTWGAANLAVYIPIVLPWPYPVRRVFWVNGSVAAGNSDFGIYTADGTKIYSTGSTANSGASVPQYVTPGTPFWLSPGRYYFAWSNDGTTNRAWGSGALTALGLRFGGIMQQTSALPLPATATFATMTNITAPLCGITRTSSGF